MKSTATLTQLLKKRFCNKEFFKFLLVGSVNTGAGYIFYLAFIQLIPYALAYSFSFALSVVVSYALNARYVFNEPLSLKKLLSFPLVYIVQYFFGLCLIYIAVEQLSIPATLAPLLVVVITIPITFLLARFIVK